MPGQYLPFGNAFAYTYFLKLIDVRVASVAVVEGINIDVDFFISIFHDEEHVPRREDPLVSLSSYNPRAENLPGLEGEKQIGQSYILLILLDAVHQPGWFHNVEVRAFQQ